MDPREDVILCYVYIYIYMRLLYPKQSWEIKMELEESGSLTSDYSEKLQLKKQYGTDTKTEI